ncbi:Zinc finger protein [Plakobranchus ocellatus]|uniref:Zinc finger protein n=1 Tax=Plakobranchus ocellatus TaxID=259542 RepID=A0AAV3ZQ83_9GAST|nr:Zinc finger protein [Plakobranchus ocellatus]
MTSASKHTEWILETIDHLRRRKARPDLARICHVVRRRFGLSPTDTEAKLEKLVDAEVVIKVDYKGSVSYRNAAKWRKSMLGCGVLNSTSISTKILEAILEVRRGREAKLETETANNNSATDTSACDNHSANKAISQNSLKTGKPPSDTGVSLESINIWLKTNSDGFAGLRSPLTVILKREIDAGRVRRLGNGNYVISPEQMAAISSGVIRPLKNVKRGSEPGNPGTSPPIPGAAGGSVASSVTSTPPKVSPSERTLTNAVASDGQCGTAVIPARRGRPPKQRPGAATVTTPPACAPLLTASASLPATNSSSGDSGSSRVGTTPAVLGPTNSKLKRMLTSDAPSTFIETNTYTNNSSSSATSASGINPTTTGASGGAGQAEDGASDHTSPHSPERKVARRVATPGELTCDFCSLSSLANPRGEPEALLQCKDCTAKAHPSCMKYSRLLASRACRAPWQCMDCKTCFMCQDSGHPDQMLFCDGCDRGFHMSCHRPPLSKKPSGIWECSDCRLENIALQKSEFAASAGSRPTLSHDSAPPTPAESPVPANNMRDDLPLPTSPMYLGEGRYPDASGWSVEDVADFLKSAGFSQQAQLFKDQEIDGVSLLLMKRSDVLRGLDMKLGPALKVNRLVQGLQTARQGIM